VRLGSEFRKGVEENSRKYEFQKGAENSRKYEFWKGVEGNSEKFWKVRISEKSGRKFRNIPESTKGVAM
jgi:hypothetical protein